MDKNFSRKKNVRRAMERIKRKWASRGFEIKHDWFYYDCYFGLAAIKRGVAREDLNESNAMSWRVLTGRTRAVSVNEVLILHKALEKYFFGSRANG